MADLGKTGSAFLYLGRLGPVTAPCHDHSKLSELEFLVKEAGLAQTLRDQGYTVLGRGY